MLKEQYNFAEAPKLTEALLYLTKKTSLPHLSDFNILATRCSYIRNHSKDTSSL